MRLRILWPLLAATLPLAGPLPAKAENPIPPSGELAPETVTPAPQDAVLTPVGSGQPPSPTHPVIELPTPPQALADSGLGLFALYDENRRLGVANLITLDLLTQAYSQIRLIEQDRYEEAVLAPLLQEWLTALSAEPADPALPEPVRLANERLLAIVTSLASGNDPADPEAAAEVRRVLAAEGVSMSPLWGYALDYGSIKPRGAYTRSAPMQRFFRAFRYANSVRLGIVPTAATGLDAAMADRQTAQLIALARALHAPAVAPLHAKLQEAAAWLYGPVNGPEWADAELALAGWTPELGLSDARRRLLEHTRKLGKQPVIYTEPLDVQRLEPDLKPADALTGWRLLPQRVSPDARLFQALVYPATGVYLGGKAVPFGLGQAGGQAVKAFPTLTEWLAAIGSKADDRRLDQAGESHFQGYPEAFRTAQAALANGGLAGLQIGLLKDWLTERTDGGPSAAAFWTQQRYISLLYTAQSSTPTAKSAQLLVPPNRHGAAIEPSAALLRQLLAIVDGHLQQHASDRWRQFRDLVERCATLAAKHEPFAAEEERFLNELDRDLLRLTEAPDRPWIVDIHLDAGSGQVVEEATGFAVERFRREGTEPLARGAALSHYEFKQPADRRLTDADWLGWLRAHSPGTTRADAARKLDNRLNLAALQARAGIRPKTPIRSVTVLADRADATALLRKAAAKGFKLTVQNDRQLFGKLPAKAIEAIAAWPEVWSVAEEQASVVPAAAPRPAKPAGTKPGK